MRMRTMTALISLLIACYFAVPCAAAQQWKWISPAKLNTLLKDAADIWLVDVGSADSYQRAHIVTAINQSALELAATRHPADRIFLLTCDSLGHMSARNAAEMLLAKGYSHVFVLEGTQIQWSAAGLPVLESNAHARAGVRVENLRWAQEADVPLRLFDLRGEQADASQSMTSFVVVPGEDLKDRLESLRKTLRSEDSISQKLVGERSVVLVFPASVTEADIITESLSMELNMDVRYLVGGYDSYAFSMGLISPETRKIGECGSCGASK